jgi:ABC-type glutathione transport system ATPase component
MVAGPAAAQAGSPRHPDLEEPLVNDNGQAEPLLVAEQVRKVYRTGGVEVAALADLDLVVRRGELVAVMGPAARARPRC